MRMTELNRYVDEFPVEYSTIDISDTVDIHKHFMKKHNINYCLNLFKKGLLDYQVLIDH